MSHTENIDPLTSAEYADSGGVSCPFCRSPTIESTGSMEADGNVAWQDIVCCDCGKHWRDEYLLDGYSTFAED